MGDQAKKAPIGKYELVAELAREQAQREAARPAPEAQADSEEGALMVRSIRDALARRCAQAGGWLAAVLRWLAGPRVGQMAAGAKARPIPWSMPEWGYLAAGLGVGLLCVALAWIGLGGRLGSLWPGYQGTGMRRSVATAAPTESTLLATRAPWRPSEVIGPDNVARMRPVRVLQSDGPVESVAFSPDGQVVAWGGSQGVWLYGPEAARMLGHLTVEHSGPVRTVAFAPDGAWLYASGVEAGGGRIRAWDWRSGAALWSVVVAPEGMGATIAVSPDGQWLGSHVAGSPAALWCVGADGLQPAGIVTGTIGGPRFSADGRQRVCWKEGALVISARDGGEQELPVPCPTTCPNDAAFAPDASLLAAALADGSLRLWRLPEGTLVRTLVGHAAPARALAFSPDGALLVSGADDNTVCFWRVADGQLLGKLRVHAGPVTSLAFSPDGCMLASGSRDATVSLWSLP